MSKNEALRVNQEITCKDVRLVGVDGEQVGVITQREALDQAQAASLDLVEISPNASPPVCKIMDYTRFRFEQKKRMKEQKKKNKAARTELKELWLRPNIDTNDVNTKIKHAKDFLGNGDKVKFTVKFRGRELAHKEKGMELLDSVLKQLEEVANIDQAAKQNGRQLIMILSPK